MSDSDIVASLLREREGYRRRNLPERVAGVDAQLKRLGHHDDSDAPETTALQAPSETTTPPRPRPRRSYPK